MGTVRLLQNGEYARRPSILNRPIQDLLTLSGYAADGSDFFGFAVYPPVVGEIGAVTTLYPFGHVGRYGAIGDGVANDTAAIQTAINNINTLGATRSKTLEFHKGLYYKTTAAINIGIVGDLLIRGNGSRLVPSTATQRGITAGGPISNVVVDGLNIVGATFALGYVFGPVTNLELKNLRVSGANANDPTLPGVTAGIFCAIATNITIDNCKFDSNGYVLPGVQTIGGDIVMGGNNGVGDIQTNVRISRCDCTSTNVVYNIGIFDCNNSSVSFSKCTGARVNDGANSFGGYGIMFYTTGNNPGACHHNKVLFNTITSTGGTGVYLQSGDNNVVAHNTISLTGQFESDGSLVVGGVGAGNCSNTLIVDNIFNSCYSSAVVVSDSFGVSTGVEVRGNKIDTVLTGVQLRPAIYLRGYVQHCSVLNNDISNIQTTGIGNRDNGAPIAVNRCNRICYNSIIGARVIDIDGAYSVAGATVFKFSQTGKIVNGDKIVVNGVVYTVSALAAGDTTCTLSGAPTFGTPPVVGPPAVAAIFVWFYRPKLTGATSRGVLFFGAQDYTVDGNDIENVAVEGIAFQDGSAGGSATSKIRVKGGSVNDHGGGGGAVYGVSVGGADCSIEGVSIHAGLLGSGYGGIFASGPGTVARFNNTNGVLTANYTYANGAFGYGNLDATNLSFDRIDARQINTQASAKSTVPLAYSAAMTPNALLADRFTVTITNAVAHTYNAPINATINQRLVFTAINTSGGAAGAATWNAIFKMAAWVQPGNGFSASIEFEFNGTSWVEISRSGTNIPN